jgi:hypothetical protein
MRGRFLLIWAPFIVMAAAFLVFPFWDWGGGTVSEAELGTGLRWLSMPVGLAVSPRPWAGWEALSAASFSEEEGLRQQPTDPLPVSSDAEFQLAYRGTMEVAGSRRYWFEDQSSGRWLELSSGEEDPATGLRLLQVAEGKRAYFQVEGQEGALVVEWEAK